MCALGSFIGFIFFPMVSDKKGPKKALVISWFVGVGGCCLMAVAYNYLILGFGYLLAGFGFNPSITLAYTMINDHSSTFFFYKFK